MSEGAIRRRRVLAAGALAALSLGLVGCAGSEPESQEGSEPESQEGSGDQVTITFAASLFGDPGTGEKLQAMLDDFNASQDAIRVEPASIPFQSIGQTVITQMAGGLGPDVTRFDTPEYYQARDGGLLAPLDIDADEFGLEPSSDEYMFDGDTRYGVVFQVASYALLYNPDLVSTPPTTFEEFLTLAGELTKDGVYGAAFRTTLPEEAGMWQDLCNYVYGFGGRFSDGENLTLNAPEVIDALNAFQEVYDAGVTPQGATASEYRTMFTEGKVAMMVDSASLVNTLRGINPDLSIDAAPPFFPVDNQGTLLAVMVVNNASQHKDAAEIFVKWMLEPDQQNTIEQVVAAGAAATPPQRDATELEETPFIPVFDDLIKTSIPQVIAGFEAKTPAVRKIIVEQVIKALQEHGDMAAAMDAAQEQAEAAVAG